MTAAPTAGPEPSTTSAVADRDRRGSIAGAWVNQLGSRLELSADTDGVLRGMYHSGVGDGIVAQPLSGRSDPPGPGGLGVLGFVVHWPADRAVSVWAGQYDPKDDVIRASWLLVGETAPSEAWRSTTLGHDEFHREGPDA
jgi:hypothetical protein